MTALIIFTAVYLVLAAGGVPKLRLDRTGACIIGASLMVGTGVVTLAEAWAAVNFDTIILLFGMMIVVANLRLSGFFGAVAEWVVAHAHSPLLLLCGIVFVAGFFSAFFVNDTMCLVLTPLVLEIAKQLRRNPVPYLLAVAMASNIGSVATITGNPQNMMVGSFSGIHYRTFAAALAPVGAVGLVLTVVVIAVFYRREFAREQTGDLNRRPVRTNRILMWKSLIVSAGMIAAFFSGTPVPQAALLAGAILLITRRVKPEKVYREIDWALLVLFAGLFVVVAGIEKTSLPEDLFRIARKFHLERTAVLSACAGVLSNLVSNVPAVLVFKPFITRLQDPQHSWLTLAMSTTLAGNLTVLGSVANLIVIQKARHEVRISFWEYFRVGAPLTILTVGAGVLLLG